ncbi:MAG: RluA family pseudouridine synthase [Catalinimonas sp.]
MKPIRFQDLILHEDDDFLVINKPPHVPTLHERHNTDERNLLDLARDYHPDAQMGHRLDKETSGALAIAKHPEAYRHLSMQFEHREVTKMYHAVVDGLHDFEGVVVYLPIRVRRNGTVQIDKAGGKEAETLFNTVRPFRRHTLVACYPVTGRMHQIRVHLACLRASIVMDRTYGGKPIYLSQVKRKFNLKRGSEEQPLIGRVALHAHTLNFARMDGERINVEAPYPKDFRALMAQLEKSI